MHESLPGLLGCRAGCNVLAYAPEVSNRQVRIGALQKSFERSLALSPRGMEEAVVSLVIEVIEIENRAEFHMLELVDEQQGQGDRIGWQRRRDGTERVPGGPADVAVLLGSGQGDQRGQARRQRWGVRCVLPPDFVPRILKLPLPLGELGIR